MDDKDRPLKLSELQYQQGLVCRRCGCRHFYVVWTRRRGAAVYRRRECRHCGWRTTTREV